MGGGMVIGFFDNEAGERYVNLADLIVWCVGYAKHLDEHDGDKVAANAVASVGLMLTDQMPPEPERRTTCQKCGGPYDVDVDAWGVCADCLTEEVQ